MRKVDKLIRRRAAQLQAERPSMPMAVAVMNAGYYLGACFDKFAPPIVDGIFREESCSGGGGLRPWRASR